MITVRQRGFSSSLWIIFRIGGLVHPVGDSVELVHLLHGGAALHLKGLGRKGHRGGQPLAGGDGVAEADHVPLVEAMGKGSGDTTADDAEAVGVGNVVNHAVGGAVGPRDGAECSIALLSPGRVRVLVAKLVVPELILGMVLGGVDAGGSDGRDSLGNHGRGSGNNWSSLSDPDGGGGGYGPGDGHGGGIGEAGVTRVTIQAGDGREGGDGGPVGGDDGGA